MRVRQLRVEVEVEILRILDLLVTEPDRLALLDQNPAEERVQNRFYVLVKVLDEQNVASGDAPVKFFKVFKFLQSLETEFVSLKYKFVSDSYKGELYKGNSKLGLMSSIKANTI